MTKIEFMKAVAEKSGLSQKDARTVMHAMQDVIFEHMKDEDGVKITDGIVLYTKYKEGRTGRNPATGETINIEAKYQPACKFGQPVRKYINE